MKTYLKFFGAVVASLVVLHYIKQMLPSLAPYVA